jgi:hypothetical protein
MSFAKREMDDDLTVEDIDPVDDAIAEAISEALSMPIAQRIDTVSTIAIGLCRSHMRRDPDLPCLCDRPGRTCHAPTIYRNEAVSVILALEKAGFVVGRAL